MRDDVLAAGALDHAYEIGEAAEVFRVADAVVRRWFEGMIPIADDAAADRLRRWATRAGERSSPEARALLYRRVLGKGTGPVGAGAVVNDAFPALWDGLMGEVALYLERAGGGGGPGVSRAGIDRASFDLRDNLAEHGGVAVHGPVRRLRAELTEALALLRHPAVLAHLAPGRGESVWAVIRRVATAELGRSPAVAAHRARAVHGNRVFRWVADLGGGRAGAPRLADLLAAAEAYILATASLGDG